ncbi:DMT family transporter [Tessaracoccus sp. HDW20]|uniref:DMT family transporter n=1 Tax=Tessaracoccus coleopterorum TaxID=2714950 RepID=UPI0018D343C5|nr:DMT family transporter [Tessaracoccus coleopterorum]NHB85309.1 DMT family transporter [Tessaracoccus coleopterorum]
MTGAASFGVGEALTLLSAAIYAVHIVALGSWAGRMDAVALAVVQLIAVAAICLVAGAPGGYDIPPVAAAWGAIAYTGLAAGIVTMVLQTWAQRHIAPTRTGLLMTLEPVFAALFAVLLGERTSASGSCSAAHWCWPPASSGCGVWRARVGPSTVSPTPGRGIRVRGATWSPPASGTSGRSPSMCVRGCRSRRG